MQFLELKMKNKKGSHVGFAIAFIVFVSFVIFLLTLVGPVGQSQEYKDSLLESLGNKIIEKTSSELTVTSVNSNAGLEKIYRGYGISPPTPPPGYTGLVRTYNYVFEAKIDDLIGDYNLSPSNYDDLKTSFGIPDANDFSFGFTDSRDVFKGTTRMIPTETEVFAEDIPVTYVGIDQNNNVEIKVGYIRVIIW